MYSTKILELKYKSAIKVGLAVEQTVSPTVSGKRQENCTHRVLTSTRDVTEVPQSAKRHDLASDQ